VSFIAFFVGADNFTTHYLEIWFTAKVEQLFALDFSVDTDHASEAFTFDNPVSRAIARTVPASMQISFVFPTKA